jgi:glycosyltransferase involved in cell wall biosynthesis
VTAADPPLRILQVITDTDRRGAQVFATDLGAGLAALGHDVTTVALAPGSRIPRLDVATFGISARGPRTLLALRRAMHGADITVAHGSSTLVACALASTGRQRPFVYRQVSDSRFWAASWNRRFRVAAYLRRPRHIVALSSSTADTLVDYLHVQRRKVTVVPNGVPAGSFSPANHEARIAARADLGLPAEGMLALYVGALVPEKGVDTAVDALAGAPGVHLAIAGNGPQRAELEQRAHQAAPGRVHFLGDLSAVAPAYRAADALVLSSKGGDSMPAVLIEASLCGLPLVSCPVGAIGEVVVDSITGLMVPSDDIAALSGALARLAADAALRERLGTAAADHCRARFTIDVVARQWAHVLRGAARLR